MASARATNGPTPTAILSSTQPSPEELQTAFDHSIWYLLSLWHPLHIAVSSGWGGPNSSDKRDWFAGAISDLFNSHPDTDTLDLETFLLQIMQDEFDCNVEDESEVPVAANIFLVRQRLLEERTLEAAREVEVRWKNRGRMKSNVDVQAVELEGEWDAVEEEEEDDEDEEMQEAPQLVNAPVRDREKVMPEMDEDGFTKVLSKKKR